VDEEVAQDLLDGLDRLKSGGEAGEHATPKTSQEMIEEARKRWSSNSGSES
jgi:hypothetical protein